MLRNKHSEQRREVNPRLRKREYVCVLEIERDREREREREREVCKPFP